MDDKLELELADIRAVAAFAAECAADVLIIFEDAYPSDARPRIAIEASCKFARGGKREKALRSAAWGALKAAQEAENMAAGHAARAAMAASAAAYLHPLAKSSQIKHILGAAAHAARAIELVAGGAPTFGNNHIALVTKRASPDLIGVLRRYPVASLGGGRIGEIIRLLDTTLRTDNLQFNPSFRIKQE